MVFGWQMYVEIEWFCIWVLYGVDYVVVGVGDDVDVNVLFCCEFWNGGGGNVVIVWCLYFGFGWQIDLELEVFYQVGFLFW